MTMKIMLPMDTQREYAVTLSEQQSLARRYGIALDAVKASLLVLRADLLSGVAVPQKTATKTKRVIADHFESSDAIGRQSALANGLYGLNSRNTEPRRDPRLLVEQSNGINKDVERHIP